MFKQNSHIIKRAIKPRLLLILTLSVLNLKAQTISVIDKETNQGIPFAIVEIHELQTHSNCDINGQFALRNISNNSPIIVSSPGFESKTFIYKKNTQQYIIKLDKAHVILNEVIISPTTGIVQQSNLTNIVVKNISEANQSFSSNLMGIVSSIPGVQTLSTGNGISKPVIRGMSGLKVLTFLNGLRIENQQWGNDHGINFSKMGIKSVEIIKGPSSLLYGADALGGVLYFIDEDYTSPNTWQTKVETSFESNTMSSSNILGLKLASETLRLNLFTGYTNAADYKTPEGSFVTNSRYQAYSFKAALGYNKDHWIVNLRYNLNSNTIGLPGHTHEANPNPSNFVSSIQNRYRVIPFQLINDQYVSLENKIFFDRSSLKLLTGYTTNSLTEHEEKVTIPGIQMRLQNLPIHLSLSHNLNEKTLWTVGLQSMFVKNSNSEEALSSLIPDSKSNDIGLYSIIKYSYQQIETQAGLRFDKRAIEINNEFSKSYSKLNGSFSMAYQKGKFTLRSNINTGYRPPHVSELFADGIHHGTNRYEIGAKDLKSEFASQLDLSLNYRNEHLDFYLNPFYNRFKDYIFLMPTDETIESLPVYNYEQASKAQTYGTEFYLHYHPHFAHRLHLEQGISIVEGVQENDKPLPLIPQTNFNTSLKYDFEKRDNKLQIETITIQRSHFLEKTDVSSFETTSEAYSIYNVDLKLKFNNKSTTPISLGVKNIFNTRYINHLSSLKNLGLPGPSRNLYFSINYIIN